MTLAAANLGSGIESLFLAPRLGGLLCFDLQKTGGVDGNYDAQAYTNQTFAGTVYAEWKLDDTAVNFVIGLSADNPNSNYTGIDFGACSQGDAKYYKMENGTPTFLANVTTGDVFRVERTIGTGAVEYKLNGATLGTSAFTSTTPLLVDSSFRGAFDHVGDLKVFAAGVQQRLTWSSTNVTVAPCGTVTGVTWTIDATRGIGIPQTAVEWADVIAAAGVTRPTPGFLYRMDETTGTTAVDAIGGQSLIAAGTGTGPVVNQTVSGWATKFFTFPDNSGRYIGGTANYATSTLLISYGGLTGTPTAERTYGYQQGLLNVTTGRVLKWAGATGASDMGTAIRPIVSRVNRTALTSAAFTDQQKVTAAYVAASNKIAFFGGATLTSAPMAVGYACAWQGADAEWTDAEIKAVLQVLGWTIPW